MGIDDTHLMTEWDYISEVPFGKKWSTYSEKDKDSVHLFLTFAGTLNDKLGRNIRLVSKMDTYIFQ